jgi:hypothetical protein
MDITQVGIVMSFGVLVAVAGLALLFFRKEQAENRIKLFGQEFQISTPALVVFLVGCSIFTLPSVIQIQNQTVFSIHPWRSTDAEQPGRVEEANGRNHQFATAKLVAIGTTIRGVIATKEQQDFFEFKVGRALNTRVILTKTSRGGFYASVTIYDNVQSKVANGTAGPEDPVSFVFQSSPNSYYYAKIEGEFDPSVGPYELLIKEE